MDDTVLAELLEVIGPGEVTPALLELVNLLTPELIEGVKIELTLKSEDGLGEVNTVVEVVDALVVENVSELVVRGDVGGGVVGGVVCDPVGDPVGDVEPNRV